MHAAYFGTLRICQIGALLWGSWLSDRDEAGNKLLLVC